jgi:hypothetical protein
MEPTPLEQEVLAVATKFTEPLIVLLFAGELMYTPPKADAQGSNRHKKRNRYLDIHSSPNEIFLAFEPKSVWNLVLNHRGADAIKSLEEAAEFPELG